ncbi:MAG TPA: ABC transporter permease [Chloroflexota bacterium]|nr:ABC transporter permease [Chloroflexota bacterium]
MTAVHPELSLPVWGNVSYRAINVWRRNWDTYIVRWRSELWPPFVEGLLQLAAFGIGVGYYIQNIDGVSYLRFIAPAIVAVTAMFQAAFETSYGSFVRMELQRTFEAIVATPVNVEEVITAELAWGATRALVGGTAVLIVVAAAGQIGSWWALLFPLAILLEGLMFSSIGMIFTSLAPEFGFFNYLATLVITPMMLFSGVFFPVSRLPQAAQVVVWFLPLNHAVNIVRALALGRVTAALFIDAAWLIIALVLLSTISLILMRRRLVK